MANNFIPSFHYRKPSEKLTTEWALEALGHLYYSSHKVSLTNGKKLKQIDDYAAGSFDMGPYKRMYKSMDKAMQVARENHPDTVDDVNPMGLDFTPLPLITPKLNSAISIVQKIPVEISCKALDPLAAEKKKEDMTFLKNKDKVEADLQEIADQMQLGKVDLGTTLHSSEEYSSSPYGLDLNEPDELDVFDNILYSLGVEAAMETVLQQFYEVKNVQQIKLLEIRDQFKYGVSCHRAFTSSLTGLPDAEYIHPQNVETPESNLPDFSDNTHRFLRTTMTPIEAFNHFGSEIPDYDYLNEMLNGSRRNGKDKRSYAQRYNSGASIDKEKWDTYKLNFILCEVKTIDWVGVAQKGKKGFTYFTENEKEAVDKIWAQNTYSFWWLVDTDYCFDIKRLDFSHRTRGEESFQNFSTNIYKSQPISAVELAIGENKKAQIAELKMQHALKMSLPAGRYIDLRFLRGALDGLNDENNENTIDTLITMALERNIILGDTEGFEGKNDGQFKPVIELAGGLKSEVDGYMRIIAQSNANIEQFTGINAQLTGQSANPEGLVGMQKLLINSSLNALYYVNEAITEQYQKLFTVWNSSVGQAIKNGGKTKEAIEDMAGKKKVSLMKGVSEVPMHRMGVFVSIEQREVEREEFRQELRRQKDLGMLSAADEFILKGISNPKDAFALLAVKEKQYRKRKEREMQMQMEQQQTLVTQQGENILRQEQERTDGKIKQTYAKGDVESKIIQLAHELGINVEQIKGRMRQDLQNNRTQGAIEKSVRTLQAKQEISNQEALS